MKFLNQIKDSIYSPEFYSNAAQMAFGKALVYFLLLALLLTIIRSSVIIFPIVTSAQQGITKFMNEAAGIYPQELVVRIQKGQVSTNVKEPYFVSVPKSGGSATVESILVIDTKTPFSTSQFNQYKAVVWLTKDSIFYKSNNSSEVKAYDLSKVDNFTIDKTFVNSLVAKITPWTKFIGPVLGLLVFIGVYLSYDFRLLYLLFFAFVLWLLSKAFKKELSYGKSYVMGMYAISLGLIVETVLGLVSGWTHFSGFLFMFTIISLGVVFVNYLQSPSKKSAVS